MRVCILLLAMALTTIMVSALEARDPVISGTTSFMEKKVYMPLDGVQVTVLRDAPVTSATSKNGGAFSIAFSTGTPVHVLFFGPDNHLPQLQSLSADSDLEHKVHVTLYTIEEAKRQGINVGAYVKAIILQLEAIGIRDNFEPLRKMKAMLPKLG